MNKFKLNEEVIYYDVTRSKVFKAKIIKIYIEEERTTYKIEHQEGSIVNYKRDDIQEYRLYPLKENISFKVLNVSIDNINKDYGNKLEKLEKEVNEKFSKLLKEAGEIIN